MRKTIVHTQITLDGRISRVDGSFWEPFPYGQNEMSRVNQFFEVADTWFLARRTYEYALPFWDRLAAGEDPPGAEYLPPAGLQLARILSDIDKVVVSSTLQSDPSVRRRVVDGSAVEELIRLKDEGGEDIIVSGGPAFLADLLAADGLVDELLLVVHPKVLAAGPRMLGDLRRDLTLTTLQVEPFEAGAVLVRYAVERS